MFLDEILTSQHFRPTLIGKAQEEEEEEEER